VVREIDSDDVEEEEDEPDAMDVDDDDDEEEDVSEEDAEGDEDDEVDAEGEEDEDMEDLPPPPAPRIVVKSQDKVPVNSVVNAKGQDAVEAKEISMLDDDEDEELSELDSDLEEGDEEDAEGEDDDEDAEGEDDEEEVTIAQNGDDDEDMDSDDDGTPASEVLDPSKMTRRQRARMEEESDGGLMALSNGTLSVYFVSELGSQFAQKHKRRNTSRQKNTPCAAQKWPVDARTSARNGMKKRRFVIPRPCSALCCSCSY
jgi:Ino eighty subunit 2